MNQLFLLDNTYFQKTYAGWMGKIIGIRMGSPIEGWTHEKIMETYGEINYYKSEYNDYAADDDSNGPAFFIRCLSDFSADKKPITVEQMGETWLNYVSSHRGFFWWGGYGISTEHTVYENLKAGITAPRSGSVLQNGLSVSEQIGGQIFVDSWGFVFPANPSIAADYAQKMVSVSHDGEGIVGGRFIAACISAAYCASSIAEVIQKGLLTIPETSHYAYVVREIIDFYKKDTKKNWKRCLFFVQATFGYDKYPGNCHIIPNAAIIILSLLYGEEDFGKSQMICNSCGWDTDCNAGNVGSILGVFKGIEGIEQKWLDPIRDLLISSSVIGNLNIDTVSNTAQYFCTLGCRMAGVSLPEEWAERSTISGRLFHFDFQKSTQAFRTSTDNVSIENCERAVIPNHRSLAISVNQASSMNVFVKTFYTPEDLSDSRYDPSFTPILFPGQSVTAVLMNIGSSKIEVSLAVYDLRNKTTYSHMISLEPQATGTITLKIPRIEHGLINRFDLTVFSASRNLEDLTVLLDSVLFKGNPEYTIDFDREMIQNYGFGHSGLHQEISQFSQNGGLWELEGTSLSGSCAVEGEAYTGFYETRDVKVSCTIQPKLGYYHLVNFRVQGAARSYAFGFYGKNTIALVKKHNTYKVLEQIPFQFNMEQKYILSITMRENRILASIDGKTVFEYNDIDSPYSYGQVGFTVLNGSHCHFQHLDFSSITNQQ
ncbi:ADP-ribosylglycohydrolase [Sphaerochaeta pleomorpha str. Grapes]|uniref:ADP-ribosylglycohydrolase n=1 Tax=Sphaerochaeta pleomorpha (strain ATCC BAA-1885 / DSM 22778 / Grapes) TaxID=158190 RepID=G8QQI1_SPHPG|nr:ADP-ribosylglycohydrolase family protein [Sphaerochaeta pleomorpha]AEV30911.1 ADP-ribosylglycohydrolase [Sphaerochaeta pleomorpha str. Grapes]